MATSSTNILATDAACTCCHVLGAVYAIGWLLAYGKGIVWLFSKTFGWFQFGTVSRPIDYGFNLHILTIVKNLHCSSWLAFR